jgi:two-component system NtrC family sensor kinase
MKRHSKAGGKAVKAGRRKAATPKRSVPAKAVRGRRSATTGQETETARLTRELKEALERQWATAEVFNAISRSKFELQTILQTVVDTASRLCRADASVIFRLEGGAYRFAAGYSLIPTYVEHERRTPISPGPGTLVGRAAMSRQVIRIEDAWTDPLYEQKAVVGVGRSMLGVPLMHEGEPIGVIGLSRIRVDPFAQREVELVSTFAAQAVIAIENTRLLEELRSRQMGLEARTKELQESLEYQTATSEVLGVISRSRFELQPVLDSVVETAARLCRAYHAMIYRLEDNVYCFAGGYGPYKPEYLEIERQERIPPGRGTLIGRTAVAKSVVQIDDALADPEYEKKDDARVGDIRSMLGVPLVRDDRVIGVVGLVRNRVDPFSRREVELVMTFADQAVIAIENTRLLTELRQRTDDLSKSLDDLRTAQDRLVQTQKLALLGQLTAGIAHEIKNPLNFVNNFSGVSVELIDELQETLGRVTVDDKTRTEIVELADTLRDNLDKIVQHGKRADSIVKNMLLHSREGSGEHRPVDINSLVEESLSLAYHGARAERQSFTITLQRSFDPTAGEADVFPQDITRVLLNVISNGFYAATKRKATAAENAYEATVTAATRNLGDRVEIRIRDNGTGIPPDVREKMFNPFFTTKPTGEGTGLGLSISHDIVVKQHAGSIEVDTEPGEFTEIKIILPRAAAATGGES